MTSEQAAELLDRIRTVESAVEAILVIALFIFVLAIVFRD